MSSCTSLNRFTTSRRGSSARSISTMARSLSWHMTLWEARGGGVRSSRSVPTVVQSLTTMYSGSGRTPLRFLDLVTDPLPRPDLLLWSGLGGWPRHCSEAVTDLTCWCWKQTTHRGPLHLFDAFASAFSAHLNTNSSLTNVVSAANRDGSLYALGLNGLTIYGSWLEVITTKSFSDTTRGLVFDPTRDLLDPAGTNDVTVFDTNTWTVVTRLPIQTSGSGNVSISVSTDGRYLFLKDPAGVRVFSLVSNVQRVTISGATIDNADFGNRFLAGNVSPLANDDDFTVAANGFVIGNLLENDVDLENDPLTLVAVNGESASVGSEIELVEGGFVVVDADGSFSFNPAGAFGDLAFGERRTVSFTYQVADNFGGVTTGTVRVTVEGRNDAPTANDDSFTTGESGVLAGSILANDFDVDGDTVAISAVNGDTSTVGQAIPLASGAMLTVNADGSFAYDPNGRFSWLRRGETASDSYTYTITDVNGETSTATVTILIQGGGGEDDLIGVFDGNWWVGVSNATSFVSSSWSDWSSFAPAVLSRGDFNGDGLVDVLGFRDGTWWVGISDGVSFVTSSWGMWSERVWKDVTQIAVGDVDGDGDDDVLARYLGSWWVGLSNGSTFTPQRWSGWSDKNWQHVTLVDLDADGDDDLLANLDGAWWQVSRPAAGSNRRPAGEPGATSTSTASACSTRMAMAAPTSTLLRGEWYVGISDGSEFAIGLWSTWRDAAWADAVVGDFNGDGRDDVAARLAGAGGSVFPRRKAQRVPRVAGACGKTSRGRT